MAGGQGMQRTVLISRYNQIRMPGYKRVATILVLCLIFLQCESRRLSTTGTNDIPLEPLSLVIITVGGSTAPPETLSKSAEVDAWLDQETFPNTLLNVGIRQMFLFGKAIKKRYSQLFESVQDPSDIYFLSKSTGPEITSVQGFGQSFFEDGVFANAEEFDALIPIPFTGDKPRLNFSTPLPNGNKPFRIYTVSQKELDVVFGLGSITACPNLNIREFTNEIEEVNKDFRFFDSLDKAKRKIQLNESLESIAKVNHLELSSRLFEWIHAQVLSVRDPFFPPGTQVYEELKVAHEAYITASQAEAHLIKIIQAPAMQLITNHLSLFIKKNGKIDPQAKKLYMLLGHNKFMIGLMMVLGLAKPECFYNKLKHYKFGTPYNETENCPEFPSPTSNIIFEVLREAGDPSSEIYIRLRYNGEVKNFIFNIPENEDLILLEDVLTYLTSGIVNPKWRSECGLDDDQTNKTNYDLTRWIIYFLLWTAGLGSGFAVFIWLFYLKSGQEEDKSVKDTEGYDPSLHDESIDEGLSRKSEF